MKTSALCCRTIFIVARFQRGRCTMRTSLPVPAYRLIDPSLLLSSRESIRSSASARPDRDEMEAFTMRLWRSSRDIPFYMESDSAGGSQLNPDGKDDSTVLHGDPRSAARGIDDVISSRGVGEVVVPKVNAVSEVNK